MANEDDALNKIISLEVFHKDRAKGNAVLWLEDEENLTHANESGSCNHDRTKGKCAKG